MELDQWTQQIEMPLDTMKILSLSRTYAATVAEIITKSNVGRQQLTKKQTVLDTSIFMEVLYGKVPENRLNECYIEAKRTRDNTFPLKPEELCTAWEVVRSKDFYKRAPESRQLAPPFCAKCNLTNTETIRNDKGIVIGARPCKH